MVTKRNPKQEAKAAAEKALAAAAKKQAAADAKAAAAEKKAEKAKKKTAAAKEKAISKAKAPVAAAAPSTAKVAPVKGVASSKARAVSSEKGTTGVRAVSGAKSPGSSRLSSKRDAAVEPPAGDQAAEEKEIKPTKRHRWLLWTVVALVAVLVLVGACFSWDRWLRYDDVADFQGEWFIADSPKAVVIDSAAINLTDDVAFSYQIDPAAKTISFSFGDKANTGRYRFSADRKQLIIVEGNSYTTLSTLFEDIAWMWEGLTRGVRGEQPIQPEAGNGTTVFQREQGVVATPAPETPVVEAPAASAPPAEPSNEADKNVDDASAAKPDEQKNAAEPEKPAEQQPGSSLPPGTMFDNVADQ